MSECIFCKIVQGEIQPAAHILEDDKTMAFLDVNPISPGHILVIPKEHYVNLENIDEDVLCAIIKTVKTVGFALKAGLDVRGYNVQANNDPIAGQVIPHLHFHVIPRKDNDGLRLWPQGKYESGQAEEVARKIKSVL